ncbi:hypothetical protein KKC94_02890 [Patescibacteria group bacterium]|nr:hypothetical protein [Patescibacteria group bacterium]
MFKGINCSLPSGREYVQLDCSRFVVLPDTEEIIDEKIHEVIKAIRTFLRDYSCYESSLGEAVDDNRVFARTVPFYSGYHSPRVPVFAKSLLDEMETDLNDLLEGNVIGRTKPILAIGLDYGCSCEVNPERDKQLKSFFSDSHFNSVRYIAPQTNLEKSVERLYNDFPNMDAFHPRRTRVIYKATYETMPLVLR